MVAFREARPLEYFYNPSSLMEQIEYFYGLIKDNFSSAFCIIGCHFNHTKSYGNLCLILMHAPPTTIFQLKHDIDTSQAPTRFSV